MTRELTSLALDLDEDWTTARKEELIEAYCSNNVAGRALIPYLGKRVEGH
jgi:hypothetical protein